MRPADTWKDYELLDATGGNRLERWGETILIRPDPQVVWKTPRQSPLWAKADAVYHRSNQGGGEWETNTLLFLTYCPTLSISISIVSLPRRSSMDTSRRFDTPTSSLIS